MGHVRGILLCDIHPYCHALVTANISVFRTTLYERNDASSGTQLWIVCIAVYAQVALLRWPLQPQDLSGVYYQVSPHRYTVVVLYLGLEYPDGKVNTRRKINVSWLPSAFVQ